MPQNPDQIGARVIRGIPTTDDARISWAWIDGYKGMSMPLGSSLGDVRVLNKPIADARNELCAAAIQQNAKYLFFMSDDVIPPSDCLISMLDKIDREFPV